MNWVVIQIVLSLVFELSMSMTTDTVGIIDVCDDIKLSFTLTINDKHTIPNGYTFMIGDTRQGRQYRYPNVYMGEGIPNRFNNRPFLHFSIGVANSHRVLNIVDFEDGIHAVFVDVTRHNLCVSMNNTDKGCVNLPNGHNIARSVKYEKNTALGFGRINNVYVESCVEDATTNMTPIPTKITNIPSRSTISPTYFTLTPTLLTNNPTLMTLNPTLNTLSPIMYSTNQRYLKLYDYLQHQLKNVKMVYY